MPYRAWYSRKQEDAYASHIESSHQAVRVSFVVVTYATEDGREVEATEITEPDDPYPGLWEDVEDRGIVERYVRSRRPIANGRRLD